MSGEVRRGCGSPLPGNERPNVRELHKAALRQVQTGHQEKFLYHESAQTPEQAS